MSDTSVSLLEHLRSNPEGEAWRRLVELYTPLLHAWLARHGVQTSDADDLVQEVLAVIVRQLPSFEHNRRSGAFRSWLRAIAVHRLRDFWRRRNYRPDAAGGSEFVKQLDQLEDPHSSASRVWDQDHDRHIVRQLLESIRGEFRQATWDAFAGVMLEGQKPAEVANRLGVSVNAVLLAKSRILARLRQVGAGIIS
jgi:RNA polymerase sigma-70 factor (ECF subfamily)